MAATTTAGDTVQSGTGHADRFLRRSSLYSRVAYIFAQSQFVREEEFSDSPDFIITAFRIS